MKLRFALVSLALACTPTPDTQAGATDVMPPATTPVEPPDFGDYACYGEAIVSVSYGSEDRLLRRSLNEAGQVLREDEGKLDRQVATWTAHEYSDTGFLILTLEGGNRPEPDFTTTYENDDRGNTLVEQFADIRTGDTRTLTRSWDVDNQLLTLTSTRDGEPASGQFEYDWQDGLLQSVSYASLNGPTVVSEFYTYDADGRIATHQLDRDLDGQFDETHPYTWSTDGSELTLGDPTAEGESYEMFLFDAENHEIAYERAWLLADGPSPELTTTHEWTEDGRLARRTAQTYDDIAWSTSDLQHRYEDGRISHSALLEQGDTTNLTTDTAWTWDCGDR